MAKLVKLEISEFPGAVIIGCAIECDGGEMTKGNNPMPKLWDECFMQDMFAPLEAQQRHIVDPSYVGYMSDWREDGRFSYIVGMMMKPDAAVPPGYDVRTAPAAKIATGWIQGASEADIFGAAHGLLVSELRRRNISASGMRWCMELYNCPRFTTPDGNGEKIMDYIVPLD